MIILIYSGTVVFSTIVDMANKIKAMRKLAGRGYKYSRIMNASGIVKLIPFINIIDSIKKIYKRNQFLMKSDEELLKSNFIIPLSKVEFKSYNQNSSIWNLLSLNIKNTIKANSILIYMENGFENIIYYAKINDKKVIVDAKGPIASQSLLKQYEKLKDELREIERCINQSSKIEFSNEKEKNYSELRSKAYKMGTLFEEQKVFIKKYLH